MAAMVSTPVPASIPPGDYVPNADERILLHGLDWARFESLVALRGERRRPRVAYLDGVVELIGPSRGHESTKSDLGRIVEHYCLLSDILITPYGSWLIKDQPEEAGAEPDECYIFGPDPESKDRPDLVIEVVWTSGGIDKLEIYRRLGIAEAWFWKDGRLAVYRLGPSGYQLVPRSQWVPDIDFDLVLSLIGVKPINEVVRRLREALGA
jgi:Uma2 family endonuclease